MKFLIILLSALTLSACWSSHYTYKSKELKQSLKGVKASYTLKNINVTSDKRNSNDPDGYRSNQQINDFFKATLESALKDNTEQQHQFQADVTLKINRGNYVWNAKSLANVRYNYNVKIFDGENAIVEFGDNGLATKTGFSAITGKTDKSPREQENGFFNFIADQIVKDIQGVGQ